MEDREDDAVLKRTLEVVLNFKTQAADLIFPGSIVIYNTFAQKRRGGSGQQ